MLFPPWRLALLCQCINVCYLSASAKDTKCSKASGFSVSTRGELVQLAAQGCTRLGGGTNICGFLNDFEVYSSVDITDLESLAGVTEIDGLGLSFIENSGLESLAGLRNVRGTICSLVRLLLAQQRVAACMQCSPPPHPPPPPPHSDTLSRCVRSTLTAT